MTRDLYNVVVTFNNATWEEETLEKLPEGTEPQISVEELMQCEKIIRKDPTVQKLASDVGQCPKVATKKKLTCFEP